IFAGPPRRRGPRAWLLRVVRPPSAPVEAAERRVVLARAGSSEARHRREVSTDKPIAVDRIDTGGPEILRLVSQLVDGTSRTLLAWLLQRRCEQARDERGRIGRTANQLECLS